MRALLLGAARHTREPLSLLMPIRQSSLFQWCLRQGMQPVKPMTLQVRGAYQEPRGPYYPSVVY